MSGDCDLCGSYDHVETRCDAEETLRVPEPGPADLPRRLLAYADEVRRGQHRFVLPDLVADDLVTAAALLEDRP